MHARPGAKKPRAGRKSTARGTVNGVTNKPDLVVHSGDLPQTTRELRDRLAGSEHLFDRDGPAKLVQPADGSPPRATRLTLSGVVMEAHDLCRPVRPGENGEGTPVTLPERVARMYLDMGDWGLRPLTGVSSAPLLTDGGTIQSRDGYDERTGLWCAAVPLLSVPEHPNRSDAARALMVLRQCFRSFPFADSERRTEAGTGSDSVDPSEPPGHDESGFLIGLLTAVCRPSLWLAPGFIITAPSVSGAGTGKGLLVRAICAISFAVQPRAFTKGSEPKEMDKRLTAELIEAQPVLFLDNVNGTVLRSDTLASVITERPARVRVLGESRMVHLNSTAFVALTGNGLTISEDLARRFIGCELDARCEDPETRDFAPGFLEEIGRRRAELLTACLTIWRWGRQNSGALTRGRPLGSFEKWCGWVRDPLITLGCRDPVERIDAVKAKDPQRQRVVELYRAWWEAHRDAPMKSADLSEKVLAVIDPQKRGRQFVTSYLNPLVGTRATGVVLERQKSDERWSVATYSLRSTGAPGNGAGHREHRDHEGNGKDPRPNGGSASVTPPTTPMPPMRDDPAPLENSSAAREKLASEDV